MKNSGKVLDENFGSKKLENCGWSFDSSKLLFEKKYTSFFWVSKMEEV